MESKLLHNGYLADHARWARKPKGLVGLEIEMEGGPWPVDGLGNWAFHTDQSLRASKVTGIAGAEYVLAQPVNLLSVREQLDTLKSILEKTKSRLEWSYRTSVHVHLNVQSFSVRHWVSLIVLSTIFEEILVDIVGRSRAGNKFCLRTSDAEGAIQNLVDDLRDDVDLHRVARAENKYASTNFYASFIHGTIEYRSMEGNLDTALITDWVETLAGLHNAAQQFDDPREIVTMFSIEGPDRFLDKFIRNKRFNRACHDVANYNQMLWNGLRLAQDLAFCIEWEGEVQAPKEPKKKKARIGDIEVADEPGGLIWGGAAPARDNPGLDRVINEMREEARRRAGNVQLDAAAPALHANPEDGDI